MAFLLPLLGALVGLIAGFSLGDMVKAGYGGMAIDMRYPLMAVGALIGYFIGRMIVGKHEDEPNGSKE